jgi:hypothetical protein
MAGNITDTNIDEIASNAISAIANILPSLKRLVMVFKSFR